MAAIFLVYSEKIPDNDGWHGAVERSGQIALQAGKHPIRIDYFQAGASKALDAFIEGPGLERQQIDEEMFFKNYDPCNGYVVSPRGCYAHS